MPAAPMEPIADKLRHFDPLEGLAVQNLDPVVLQVVQRLSVDAAVLRERISGAERDLRSQESALREIRMATDYNASIRPQIDDFKDQLQSEMRSMAEQCKLEAKALVKVLREEMMSQSLEWRRTNASLSSLRSELAQKHAPRDDLNSMESRLLGEMHQQAAAIRTDLSQPYNDLKNDLDVQHTKVDHLVGSQLKKNHIPTYISDELQSVRLEEKRLEDEVKEMSNRLSELENAVSEGDVSPNSRAHQYQPAATLPAGSPVGSQQAPSSLSTTATFGASSGTVYPPQSGTSPNKAMPSESKSDHSDHGVGPRGVNKLRDELVNMRFT